MTRKWMVWVFCAFMIWAGSAPANEQPSADLGTSEQPSEEGAKRDAKAGPRVDQGAEAYRIVNQKDEIVSVLRNGMTVIAKRVPSPVLAVRGYALTGGVYEGRWLGGGLSHLLEHLVAGGTNDRRTEAQNRELLEKLGNNSNAYTTTDHTCYFVNTTTDRLDGAADLVTGWMLGAHITPDEYAREYEVVQRELEMGKGEPDRVFWYLNHFNRYRVSPARVPVIGYQEVIQGLSRDDVYEYYKLAYQPNNMVFSLAGDVEPERMLEAVRKHVADAAPGREFSHDIPDEPPVLSPRTVVATFPKLGQAKLALGFPSIKLDHPDLFALDLLAQVLASGDSSILVEELRDNRQLVSGVSALSLTPEYVEGTFGISMELDADKIQQATDAVLEVIESVKKDGVDADRLRRAQTQMKVARVRRLQTSEEIASSLAEDYMSAGDPHFSDLYVQRIQDVTNDQIKEVANRYLDAQRMLTTALLPAEYVGAEGLPKAEDLLRPALPAAAGADTTAPEDPASAVRRVELDDGTVLLAKRISTSPLVVMSMYSLGGVSAESENNNGVGNLAMQLVPRGTETRTARQVAEFFDSIGGSLETTCGNNTWLWSASCLSEDFEKAFEVYADCVRNPAFPEAEVTAMKRRLIAQIQSQDADWHQQAFRFFKKSYYGPQGSPYQFMPVGTEQNVSALTTEQVGDWYRQQVLAAPRVLAIYGDIDPAEAEKVARRYLGEGLPRVQRGEARISSDKVGGARKFPAKSGKRSSGKSTDRFIRKSAGKAKAGGGKASVTVERVEVQKTEQPLAGVVIGFQSNTVVGGNYELIVADTVTSGYGYPTGYLHEILRGRGLVYVVHAQLFPGRSEELPGTFFVYAGCDPAKVNEVVDVILENVARLQGTPEEVNEDWFGRAKELTVVSDAMNNQTPAEQAQTAALDELMGLGYDFHDRFAEGVQNVSLQAVREQARARLAQCVVTVSTPQPDAVTVEAGRREYESFPPIDMAPQGVQHDAAGTQ